MDGDEAGNSAVERRRDWHFITHDADIPSVGDYQTLKVGDELVFVVRSKDGRVRAFHNVCRHRAARLLDGEGGHCAGLITCPYHAWSYALDGRLVGVPNREDYAEFDLTKLNLVPVQMEERQGEVFVWV